jgi:ParB-like chromosome segregation protein Spo0J
VPKKPKRRIEYVRLDRIEFANRNPKLHDTDGVAGSINRFGMAAVPTRDERTGRLVAGHGRIEALQLMRSQGQAAPAGVKTDKDGMWLVPVMAGWSSRSDAEAEAYLIGDNEWTARGSWDIRELAALLQEMQMFSPDLMQHTGITLERLEDMVAALDAPEDSLGEGDSASKNDDGWPTRCPAKSSIPSTQ